MIRQPEMYERFKALHEGTAAFVLGNAWDAASAVILRDAGMQALGTSSAAIAYALGRADGTHSVSLQDSVANGTLLTRVSGLPVNGDLEDGYGPAPDDCVATVEAAIAGGLAGLGIEDTTADPARPIHDFDAAVARIVSAARAARGRIMLTGRTDVLLHKTGDTDEAIRRLVAFAEVGADVLYAPGFLTMDEVRKAVAAVAPKPLNVLLGAWSEMSPLADLTAVGVKRVSLGGALFSNVMGHLAGTAARIVAGELTATTEHRSPIGFNARFG